MPAICLFEFAKTDATLYQATTICQTPYYQPLIPYLVESLTQPYVILIGLMRHINQGVNHDTVNKWPICLAPCLDFYTAELTGDMAQVVGVHTAHQLGMGPPEIHNRHLTIILFSRVNIAESPSFVHMVKCCFFTYLEPSYF
jgi:hypothetical protein